MTTLTADEIASIMTLAPHPAGGRFRETFRDETAVTSFRLLAAGERIAWAELSGVVEVWQFYDGAPLTLTLASREGAEARAETLVRVGGQGRSQIGVPNGWWRSAETSGDWSLVGVTQAPAFDLPEQLTPA